MKYVMAAVACLSILMVYIVTSALMGWKHGGGAIPMMILFATCTGAWKAITKSKGKGN
jgi:hypothetical protein